MGTDPITIINDVNIVLRIKIFMGRDKSAKILPLWNFLATQYQGINADRYRSLIATLIFEFLWPKRASDHTRSIVVVKERERWMEVHKEQKL